MRIALLAIFLLAVSPVANATGLPGAASSASSPSEVEAPNFAYALSLSGGMRTTRYAKADYAESLRAERPECVLLNWSLASKAESLSVKNEEVERINLAIADVTKTDPTAALVITTVGPARGLWVFYSASGISLAKALDEQLQGKTKTPVVLKVVSDPKWNGFRNYVARLKQPE